MKFFDTVDYAMKRDKASYQFRYLAPAVARKI